MRSGSSTDPKQKEAGNIERKHRLKHLCHSSLVEGTPLFCTPPLSSAQFSSAHDPS